MTREGVRECVLFAHDFVSISLALASEVSIDELVEAEDLMTTTV